MKNEMFEREFLVVIGATVIAGGIMIGVLATAFCGVLYVVKSLFF